VLIIGLSVCATCVLETVCMCSVCFSVCECLCVCVCMCLSGGRIAVTVYACCKSGCVRSCDFKRLCALLCHHVIHAMRARVCVCVCVWVDGVCVFVCVFCDGKSTCCYVFGLSMNLSFVTILCDAYIACLLLSFWVI
jgi:hypothetical protein